MDDAVNVLVLIAGLLSYLITGVVVRSHFSSTSVPREVYISVLLSYAGVAAFVWLMLRSHHAVGGLIAALGFFMASNALFFWTVATTRSQRPRLAFDPEPPGFLLQVGPYRYIRHPFYASYLLFWLGCAVATLHPLGFAILIVMIAYVLVAAFREERSFDGTPFAADYRRYRQTAGLLWPRVGAAHGE
jgi:protein-S-isoprenylcysteine O-methyltransferase Ste14